MKDGKRKKEVRKDKRKDRWIKVRKESWTEVRIIKGRKEGRMESRLEGD